MNYALDWLSKLASKIFNMKLSAQIRILIPTLRALPFKRFPKKIEHWHVGLLTKQAIGSISAAAVCIPIPIIFLA